MVNNQNAFNKTAPAMLLSLFVLAACATGKPSSTVRDDINAEMAKAATERVKPSQPDAVSSALLPPLKIEMPQLGAGSGAQALDARFDLVVNNAPATQVFMGIVSGTRYSMLVHPEVTGAISVNLKDVNVIEALGAIRELYGYDYKIEGTRISVQPLTIQTRIFQVSYLTGQRQGSSEVRVTGASVISGGAAGTVPAAGAAGGAVQSANVKTASTADFWDELSRALIAIVGNAPGRSVVISPQTGVIVVRALPDELKNVAAYLKASQLSAERQVILEAKIIEVRLSDGHQQGINWASFLNWQNGTRRLSLGQAASGTVLQPTGNLATGASGIANNAAGGFDITNPQIGALPGSNLINFPANPGNFFGLAFQTRSFAALLSFLETQGAVHVLSSPRIATLNNQKAVLKVGQDELFVTNVSGGTQATATVAGTSPTVTLQSFFSGISLDVTPRIDEDNNIILHVHPSISNVTQENREVQTGGTGTFRIPVPRSAVQETDSIVRAQDGQIVAIGGLMSQRQVDDRQQLPGVGNVPGLGALFRNSSSASEKHELVILLKPTVIHSDQNWAQDILQSQGRIEAMGRKPSGEAAPQIP